MPLPTQQAEMISIEFPKQLLDGLLEILMQAKQKVETDLKAPTASGDENVDKTVNELAEMPQ